MSGLAARVADLKQWDGIPEAIAADIEFIEYLLERLKAWDPEAAR